MREICERVGISWGIPDGENGREWLERRRRVLRGTGEETGLVTNEITGRRSRRSRPRWKKDYQENTGKETRFLTRRTSLRFREHRGGNRISPSAVPPTRAVCLLQTHCLQSDIVLGSLAYMCFVCLFMGPYRTESFGFLGVSRSPWGLMICFYCGRKHWLVDKWSRF